MTDGLSHAIALLLAATVQLGEWLPPAWRGPLRDDRLEIDLVRADVTVAWGGPEASVSILPVDADMHGADLEVVRKPGVVRVRDVYPATPTAARECLPPVSDRGNFWSYPTRFAAHVIVPRGAQLRIRVMQGDIALPAGGRAIDAATGRGTVRR